MGKKEISRKCYLRISRTLLNLKRKKNRQIFVFCRKTSDKSGNYHFSRDDGEEVCYTAAHHGTDPRLSPPDAAEILRLLTPILSEKKAGGGELTAGIYARQSVVEKRFYFRGNTDPMCRERCPDDEVTVYTDRGFSGKNLKRPRLSANDERSG